MKPFQHLLCAVHRLKRPELFAGLIATCLMFGISGVRAEVPFHHSPVAGDVVVDNTVPVFKPMVKTGDYVKLCGDYQRINKSPGLQRLSRGWQRCFAYTSAVIATMQDIERTAVVKQFCVPSNVDTGDTIGVAVKYARKIPETMEENPAKIILEALAVRYPC